MISHLNNDKSIEARIITATAAATFSPSSPNYVRSLTCLPNYYFLDLSIQQPQFALFCKVKGIEASLFNLLAFPSLLPDDASAHETLNDHQKHPPTPSPTRISFPPFHRATSGPQRTQQRGPFDRQKAIKITRLLLPGRAPF